MPDGIFGKKLGMTRIFDDDGTVVPVTVIEAGPCFVVQKKTSAKDGYEALQVGFERRPLAKVNKPEAGHLEKHGSKSGFVLLREIRVENAEGFEPGQELTVEQFAIGDRLMVTGTSRGRGFTGTVKRWGFHVGPRTHGSMSHRAPGSIGASAYPFPGGQRQENAGADGQRQGDGAQSGSHRRTSGRQSSPGERGGARSAPGPPVHQENQVIPWRSSIFTT
jgi:large subunit ribosomal protein L3